MDYNMLKRDDIGVLRVATEKDINILFEWVNEDGVRASAFNSNKILYDEHKRWYSNVLNAPDVIQLIYEYNNVPIGQARVNFLGEEAELDYSIQWNYRGMGYGKKMLHLLEEYIKDNYSEIKRVIAKVKYDNVASQMTVKALGYKEKYYCYELEL